MNELKEVEAEQEWVAVVQRESGMFRPPSARATSWLARKHQTS